MWCSSIGIGRSSIEIRKSSQGTGMGETIVIPPAPETFFVSDFHHSFKCCSHGTPEKEEREKYIFFFTGSVFFCGSQKRLPKTGHQLFYLFEYMQERSDAGLVGCMKGGMQEKRDAGKEG